MQLGPRSRYGKQDVEKHASMIPTSFCIAFSGRISNNIADEIKLAFVVAGQVPDRPTLHGIDIMSQSCSN